MTNKNEAKPENATAEELSTEELEQAQGGLLLPAVQKVREAAARLNTTGITDGTSNIAGDGSV